MFIENVTTKQLASIISGLVQRGLTFRAFERAPDTWTIELTGGY
jgi:hypothetical protein